MSYILMKSEKVKSFCEAALIRAKSDKESDLAFISNKLKKKLESLKVKKEAPSFYNFWNIFYNEACEQVPFSTEKVLLDIRFRGDVELIEKRFTKINSLCMNLLNAAKLADEIDVHIDDLFLIS